MSYKLAIIGSRTFNDYNELCLQMSKLPKPALIVSGGAKGADSLGKQYADDFEIPTKIFPAIWRPDGEEGEFDRGAGMKRNVDIINESDAVLAFWDAESRGTMHSIDLSIQKRKHVRIIYTDMPKKEATKDILGFQRQNRWLSNTWPVEFTINGLKCMSVESGYQAAKFVGNTFFMREVAKMPAFKAKEAGRKYQITTKDFDAKRRDIMKKLVREKFKNPWLRKKLLLTGNVYIEETNDWGDCFFGCCPQGVGENNLGKIIMEIREEIRKETQ